MKTFYSNSLKAVVKQISKKTARRLFTNGETIYLQSSNMLFDNVWQYAAPVNKLECDNFECFCNNYKYYNCDSQRGKYIHFFVTE